MPVGGRSAAERILKVPVLDGDWDPLWELARENRQDPRDWASVELRRIIRRRCRQLGRDLETSEVA